MPKKKRINSRTKGHTFERELVKVFKELGFDKCQTSRYASRILDDSKIDLANIPLNVQAKIGYDKNRPKFEEIFTEMKENLEKNFMKDDKQITYPKVIFHKLDGKKPENFAVIMPFNEWIELYKKSIKND